MGQLVTLNIRRLKPPEPAGTDNPGSTGGPRGSTGARLVAGRFLTGRIKAWTQRLAMLQFSLKPL